MSGEFGDDNGGGFFHEKLRGALENAEGGSHGLTRLVGEVLRPLAEIARDISWAEAGDSGEDRSRRSAWDHLPALRAALWNLERSVEDIGEAAVDGVAAGYGPLPEPRRADRGMLTVTIERKPPTDKRMGDSFRRYVERHVNGWARENATAGHWAICSYGGPLNGPTTYALEMWPSDRVARAALEEIEGAVLRGASLDAVKAILERAQAANAGGPR